MSTLFKPVRTMGAQPGNVFFAMPFGTKTLTNGTSFDFDGFYADVCVPLVSDECGMEPVRVDGIYGSQGVLETVWRAMQQAHIVVADLTARSVNVSFELGWALLLGKRTVLLTQEADDVPTDIKGLFRYIPYSPNYADMQRMRNELALELRALSEAPAEEMAPMPMPGGSRSSMPARVISVSQDYVVVQDERGRRGVMGNGDVEYSRLIKDMRRRFEVDQRIDGAFVIDPMRSEMRYTLLGAETNPWPLLESRYPAGTTVKGRVHSVVEQVGAFVTVDLNVNGLIPWTQLPSAAPRQGDEVEVTVTRVDSAQRRIGLKLKRPLTAVPSPAQEPFAAVGWRGYCEVVRTAPEHNGRGGFILLARDRGSRPAMLLAKHMSTDLRADLNDGQVEIGEEIYVEVLSVDTARARTLLREIPDDSDSAKLDRAG
ncbi:S1 RNA-binding domain-containing protein [Streptomyces sp. 142MFCol3.1]|uniref:S1 RNA-binding domain-containing protein n=1 Tax=Streptomyces sp. 142MFCol3.1 TaxID=1172179 RepID=UPI000412AB1C|nr:S1 RNA-binding domain-containing protein [Streptomyces sp. 142MFCol3.1]